MTSVRCTPCQQYGEGTALWQTPKSRTDFVSRLYQPSYMHVDPVDRYTARQEVAILIAEDVADLRRNRRIVAEEAELVADLEACSASA